jgi:hypothetical protein
MQVPPRPDDESAAVRAAGSQITVSGGRTWSAQFELTRINITPTILPKKIEDVRQSGAMARPETAIEGRGRYADLVECQTSMSTGGLFPTLKAC